MSNLSKITVVHLLFNERYSELNKISNSELEKIRLEGGNTLLHIASQTSLELCKILLPKFSNINEVNVLNKTALHYCKDNSIRNYFLENGMCY